MTVQLFIPCFVDQFYPVVGMNTVKILEKVGCTIKFNDKQTCCGKPAFQDGFMKEAKAVCTKFITDFSEEEIIVAPSSSCVSFVKSNLQQLFQDGLHKDEAKRIQNNIYELSEFLVEVKKVEDLGAQFEGVATFHDACSSLSEGISKQTTRKLLQKVKGLELVENDERTTCCGMGGTFAKKFDSIANGMAHTKMQAVKKTKADYIISSDLTCLMHLDKYIEENDLSLKTMHLADVLAKF